MLTGFCFSPSETEPVARATFRGLGGEAVVRKIAFAEESNAEVFLTVLAVAVDGVAVVVVTFGFIVGVDVCGLLICFVISFFFAGASELAGTIRVVFVPSVSIFSFFRSGS